MHIKDIGRVMKLIQQIGNVQQNTQAFSKKATQSTDEDFSKVLTPSIEKLETIEMDKAIYSDLAAKYDVRNATFDELKEIAQELYGAGAITGKDVATLTFDYNRATKYIQQAAGFVFPNFSMYETNEETTGHRDWIAEFEARAAKDRQYGNFIGNANKTRIISILQFLER